MAGPEGGDNEVIVNVDINPEDPALLPFRTRLAEYGFKGSSMSEAQVRNAMRDIDYTFEEEMKVGMTPEHLKNDPKLVKMLKIGLFYALYRGIEMNSKISPQLRTELLNKSVKPGKSGGKDKLAQEGAEGLLPQTKEGGSNIPGVEHLDPLLKDPLVKQDTSNVDLSSAASNVDQGVEDFYDEMFKKEVRIGHMDFSPTQKLVLAFFYNNYFKPITDNVRDLNARMSKEKGISGVGNVIWLSLQRDLNKLARDVGQYVLENVVFDKDFNVYKLRNVVLTVAGFIDDYNHSAISLLSSLLWKRDVVHFLMPSLKDLGFEVSDAGGEGELLSVVTSVADLSLSATAFLKQVEKRKLEDVARTRPADPEKYRRQKLLVQFLVLAKHKVQKSGNRNAEIAIDFALGMISRLRDDGELAVLGEAIKPVVRYLAQIPGGIQDGLFKQYPKLKEVAKVYPALFDDVMTFFIPQNKSLSGKSQEEFQKKYGILFTLVEDIVKSSAIPLSDDLRYAITFGMENVKSYFRSEKDANKILGVVAFINASLEPYKKEIPKYLELAETLDRLAKEVKANYKG